jgi:hypothetical protein
MESHVVEKNEHKMDQDLDFKIIEEILRRGPDRTDREYQKRQMRQKIEELKRGMRNNK